MRDTSPCSVTSSTIASRPFLESGAAERGQRQRWANAAWRGVGGARVIEARGLLQVTGGRRDDLGRRASHVETGWRAATTTRVEEGAALGPPPRQACSAGLLGSPRPDGGPKRGALPDSRGTRLSMGLGGGIRCGRGAGPRSRRHDHSCRQEGRKSRRRQPSGRKHRAEPCHRHLKANDDVRLRARPGSSATTLCRTSTGSCRNRNARGVGGSGAISASCSSANSSSGLPRASDRRRGLGRS